MSGTTGMKMARDKAFADPKRARKLARDVKAQSELRLRLRNAILDQYPNFDNDVDPLVDVIIEELKQ